MSDFEAILRAYEASGGDPRLLQSNDTAQLVVSGNEVLSANSIEGVTMEAEQLADGIRASVTVAPGTIVEHPVHLCFGVVPEKGVQRIIADFEIGRDAKIAFQAHCTFPNAVDVQHIMEGTVHVGPHATMTYNETHYHGPDGGVQVLPKTTVTVDEGAHYASEFNLSHGRAGRVDVEFIVDVARDGVAELNARIMGSADDTIKIQETVRLNGERARGLVKSRIAVRDRARAEVIGSTEGNAPFSRGHVDCVEIVRDQAIAIAIPIVRVTDHRAHVTHEAAIGTVEKKELETLMARGLDEDTAVDVIVRGMLGQ